MGCIKPTKLINLLLTACILFLSPINPANAEMSIEEASSSWGDAAARDKLLSVVPKWSPQKTTSWQSP